MKKKNNDKIQEKAEERLTKAEYTQMEADETQKKNLRQNKN